jgi:uncharacterized protein DUF1707
MAEPRNELAAGVGGQGSLQASHADRESVIEMLKTAFVQGRLDRDEFDLRVGRALASRTYADLAALTVDIPAPLARARPPEPARESVSKTAVVAMACATVAFIGLSPVMFMRPPWPRFVLPAALVWFVLVMVVPTGWLALLNDWLGKRADWRSAQRLPPGAGGAASPRPVPASSCD